MRPEAASHLRVLQGGREKARSAPQKPPVVAVIFLLALVMLPLEAAAVIWAL